MERSKKVITGMLLTVFLVSTFITYVLQSVAMSPTTAGSFQTTYVSVVNPETGDRNFTYTTTDPPPAGGIVVNITVIDVTTLAGWQVNLTWDPTLLQIAVPADVYAPPDHVFNGLSPVYCSKVINNTKGFVTWCCAIGAGAPVDNFNGSGRLMCVKFTVIKTPTESEPLLSCDLVLDRLGLFPTNLVDPDGNDISFTEQNGYYEYAWSPPLPCVHACLGIETFPPGTYKATIIWEDTAAKYGNPFGWYSPVGTVCYNGRRGKAPGILTMVELFSGSATVGATVQFTVDTYFGFWLNNTNPSQGCLSYTENMIQPDPNTRANCTEKGYDHAKVEYANPLNPCAGYIIKFEDGWNLYNKDYNDMWVKLVPTSYRYVVKFEHGYKREVVGPDCNACALPRIPIETLIETHVNVLNPNEFPVNLTKKFVKIYPQHKHVFIIDPLYKRAYFGWYRAHQMPTTGWDLLKRTIEWATGGTPPASTKIVLFTWDGSVPPACPSPRPDPWKDADTVYCKLISAPWGYTNIFLKDQQEAETLPPSYYWDKDLVIYWNPYGYCSKNIIESGVPFITVSYMQTDEMGIGTGRLAIHESGQTFCVVNNHFYPTQTYPMGESTFENNMWFDGTVATGGIPLVVSVGPEPYGGRTEKVAVDLLPPNKGFEIDAADIQSWPPDPENEIFWPPKEWCETYWKGFVVIESPGQTVINNRTVPLSPLEVVAVYSKKTVDIVNKITFHHRFPAYAFVDTAKGRFKLYEPYELTITIPYEPENITLAELVKRELNVTIPYETDDIDVEIVETASYFDLLECVVKEKIVFTLQPTNQMVERFLNETWPPEERPEGWTWPDWIWPCRTLEKIVKVQRLDEIIAPQEIVGRELFRELKNLGVPPDPIRIIWLNYLITILDVDVAEGVGTSQDVEYIEPEIIDP